MAYSSIFDTAENRKRKWDSSIYEISERVSSFFWDNAPHQYGLEAREGQQDMAFEILDAIRGSYHIAVEAGVGLENPMPILFHCSYIIRKQSCLL